MKKRRRIKKIILFSMLFIAVMWIALTMYVETEGPLYNAHFGNPSSNQKALIVYDPDPFYDLDRQVCESFAQGFAEKNWYADVISVRASKRINTQDYDLYVFCANTYNWYPDHAITGAISEMNIEKKNVVNITLGAGSTSYSKSVLDKLIKSRHGRLRASETWWLWRPNEGSGNKVSNTATALRAAREKAGEIAWLLSPVQVITR